jgi:acyl carrier protein
MTEEVKAKVREIIAEILEVEPDELEEDKDFEETYEADSLRKIEIVAKLEKALDITIPQTELAKIRTLKAVYQIVGECMGA